MNLRFAVLVAAAALLSACATAPKPLQGSFTQVNPRDAVATPQVGAPVRWGGRIISTTPGPNSTCFQLVSRPLGATDPVLADGKLSWAGGSVSFKQAAAKLPVEQVSAQAMRTPEYGAREFMFLGGVQFCEVEVDTETGIVRPLRFLAVHDCGRPLNPLGLRSQVNGGIIQGISYALHEERKLDRQTGVMVNANLDQYKISGSRDVPEIEVHFIEEYLGRSSTDASGVGEPATIPTAAALANAFHNATGVRMRQLPMTPARVLQALGRIGGAA